MTNVIFYVLMLSLFLSFSTGAMNYSGVNRTFISLYRGLIEASVATLGEDGEESQPYFSERALEAYVDDYFEINLSRYVHEYTVAFYYYDLEDGSMCTDSHCQGVRISLKTNINYLFHYEKAKLYYIKGGGLLNE